MTFLFFYFSPYIFRYFSQTKIHTICKKKGYVILTYDDGPSCYSTGEIIDLLDSHNVKATFFVLGAKVAANINLIQRMVSSGHEVGCHGYEHVHAWKQGPWMAINDVIKGNNALLCIGITPKLFRPPYGKITIFTWIAVFFLKMRLVWWNSVSGDTFKNLPRLDSAVDKFINSGGGIILMHDFHENIERKNYVLTMTKMIIEKANKNGLQIKTVNDLFLK